MCSRYSLTSPHEAVRSYFRYQNRHEFPPRYNIAPAQPVGIVGLDANGVRTFDLVRWGLIPPWVKDPRTFAMLINARAETVHEKPSFKGALRHKRCLVPADGFYEWTGRAGAKRPHLIRPRGGGPMAFAALRESWLGADGSEVDTMAILTVTANATLGTIHDRMPAILDPGQFEAWLDCRRVDVKAALDMLHPASDDLLEVIEIEPRINDVRKEGADLQRPASAARLL